MADAAPPTEAAAQLPGTVLVSNLYRRLFRPEPIGPTIVVIITILGGIAGIYIWRPAWPLLALAIGGTAAALWRILVGDRSHAADLVSWRYEEQLAEWDRTVALDRPVSPESILSWTKTDAFRKARPLDQAKMLIPIGELDRARKLLERAAAENAADRADVAAARFNLEFTEHGEADFVPWADAIGRLDAPRARGHRASMAIYEAAFELAHRGPWLITLDKAAAELGPFDVPPRRRLLRRIFPLVPVLLGISALAVVAWIFIPAAAA